MDGVGELSSLEQRQAKVHLQAWKIGIDRDGATVVADGRFQMLLPGFKETHMCKRFGIARIGGEDCVDPEASLYLPGRATDYGDTRLVK